MKLRIMERNDGNYEVYIKKHFFCSWQKYSYGPFPFLESAKRFAKEYIEEIKNTRLQIHGRKIKRIVEEISG